MIRGKLIVMAFAILSGFAQAADPPMETWKSQALPRMPASALLAAATSPDGKYRVEFPDVGDKVVPPGYPILAARLLDANGRALATWRKIGPSTAAFSPDGTQLAIGTDSGMIDIVSLKDRKIVRTFKSTDKKPMAGIVTGVGSLLYSPSTTTPVLISASGDGSLFAWDPNTGKQIATLEHGQKAAVTLLPGPKETILAIIGQEVRKTDFTLKKWEGEHKLAARVLSTALPADRSVLAVAAIDLSVTILDTETLKPVATFKEKGDPPPAEAVKVAGYYFPFALAITPKGDRLFTATPDQNGGTITVWDAKTGQKRGSFIHPPPRGTLGNPTLHLSVTAEGKVKSFWSNVSVYPPLLWSVQEKKD
jgi:WD40 repeat protein